MVKKCPAKLKNGNLCQNMGKNEFNGFCGVHKNYSQKLFTTESLPSLERVWLLYSIYLEVKKYLPEIIQIGSRVVEEIVVHSGTAFISQSEYDAPKPVKNQPGRMRREHDIVKYVVGRDEFGAKLKQGMDEKQWEQINFMIEERFLPVIQSGKVPRHLVEKCKNARILALIDLKNNVVK